MNNIQNNLVDLIQSNNLRKNLFTLILVFTALFLIVETVLTYKEAVDYKNPSNMNFISVNGKSERYVKPDTLLFSININEEGKDNLETTQKVADKNKKAIDILKANGIKDEDIKLDSYYIQDKYESVKEPCAYSQPVSTDVNIKTMIAAPCYSTNSKIVGQIITQRIKVKIRDIEKNANNEIRTKIINELSAQNIKADEFTFIVYDIDSVRKEIREEAIKNAKEDAKKLAKQLGVRLGDLSNFSDNANSAPVYGMGGDMSVMKSSFSEASAPVKAPELNPGQEKVSVDVTLTYSIK